MTASETYPAMIRAPPFVSFHTASLKTAADHSQSQRLWPVRITVYYNILMYFSQVLIAAKEHPFTGFSGVLDKSPIRAAKAPNQTRSAWRFAGDACGSGAAFPA